MGVGGVGGVGGGACLCVIDLHMFKLDGQTSGLSPITYQRRKHLGF